jgi:hypothetical protein
MLAAALIPMIFIVGLLVLFLLGAWPYGLVPSLVAVALLVAAGIGLVRYLRTPDARPHA